MSAGLEDAALMRLLRLPGAEAPDIRVTGGGFHLPVSASDFGP